MTTERTPAEWARFCAEKVMGWHWYGGLTSLMYSGRLHASAITSAADNNWSPWDNLADAREVLERLREEYRHRVTRQLPDVHIHVRHRFGDDFDTWTVNICNYEAADAPGHHEGPAICLLAAKIRDANND